MADDVEELIRALALEDVVVMGWSFGSFVTEVHMAGHGSASAYVLLGTVATPHALTDRTTPAASAHELAQVLPRCKRSSSRTVRTWRRARSATRSSTR